MIYVENVIYIILMFLKKSTYYYWLKFATILRVHEAFDIIF